MPFFFVLFHDCSSSNFFSTVSISTTLLGGLFNVLIFALLLLAHAFQWFFPWHSMSLLFISGRKHLSSAFIIEADFLLTHSTRLKLDIRFKECKSVSTLKAHW